MREFLMNFYSYESGVSLTVRWKDEREYLLAKAYLEELLGDEARIATSNPDKAPSYFLENDRLYDALFKFQRRLREGAEPGG